MTEAHLLHLAFLCFLAEHWKVVPGWPAYQASSYGRVMSYWKRTGKGADLKFVVGDKGKLLKPQYRPADKHWHYTLCNGRGNGQETLTVGRIVLMTFDRLPEPGEAARHYYDPDTSNNHLWNLRWGSQLENAADRVRHGNSGRKLTTEAVREIRLMLRDGIGQQAIADKFGITNSLVSMIKTGKKWSHVPQLDAVPPTA